MSKSINRVALLGYVGADPEVRTTPQGKKVATVSLATTKITKNAKGESQERTQWHRVICWDSEKGAKLADLVESYVGKGDRLYVAGEIEYRSWEDKQGAKRYMTEIVAQDIVLLTTKAESTAKAATPGPKRGADPFDDVPDALQEDDDDLPF